MEDTGREHHHPSSEDTSAPVVSSKDSEPNEGAKQTARAEKARAIRKACAARDVEALAMHATSEGGLLEDGLRQIACESFWSKEGAHMDSTNRRTGPVLLRCDERQPLNTVPSTEVLRHADEEQVELDVNRSFVYYPKGMPLELPVQDEFGC